MAESDTADQSNVRTLVTNARDCLVFADDEPRAPESPTCALTGHEALSSHGPPMSDLVITRQFVEQVEPEALRAELLRHIDEGVRKIHISLTLPLLEPVRCIARD